MVNNKHYYHNYNPDLLAWIPAHAKTVIEFGCGAGALARAYKRINPQCHYSGVELEESIVSEAGDVLDRTFIGDIEQMTMADLAIAGGYDVIVYGDLLEHLYDPWQILQQHLTLLKPHGVVVASIPNIQHWTILIHLLQGRWDYADSGLLDRTHLRFFTLATIEQLFTRAGLRISEVFPRKMGITQAYQPLLPLLRPLLHHLQLQPALVESHLATLQFVVRATRSDYVPPRLYIHMQTIAPYAAVNDKRIDEPARFLTTLPGVRTRIESQHFRTEVARAGELRLFIFHRHIFLKNNTIHLLRPLLQDGFLLIAEHDDDPDHWPEHAENNYLSFRGVHAVQTTTPTMATTLQAHNPNIALFANQIAELPPLRLLTADRPQLTILFAALNRIEDGALWYAAMAQLIARYPQRLRFIVVHNRAFYDQLPTDQKQFKPLCDYAAYLQLLQQSDINLLPLQDNRFNRHKSDLKWIESAACGTVAIASPTVYSNSIRHGETGFIVTTGEEVVTAIASLIEQPILHRQIVTAAYQQILQQRLHTHHLQARYDWYLQLFEQREQLTRDLIARVPELRS